MKLYSVKIEQEVIVIAEDEDAAESAAHEAVSDMGSYEMQYDVSDLSYLPFGWTGKELPWTCGDDIPERTIDEWIEAGAAPVLTARMAKEE